MSAQTRLVAAVWSSGLCISYALPRAARTRPTAATVRDVLVALLAERPRIVQALRRALRWSRIWRERIACWERAGGLFQADGVRKGRLLLARRRRWDEAVNALAPASEWLGGLYG